MSISANTNRNVGNSCPDISIEERSHRHSLGFTLFEMLAVIALTSILAGVAVMNLKALDNPLNNGRAQLASFIKVVRARAISSTSAYTIIPDGFDRIITSRAETCAAVSQVEDESLTLTLPEHTVLASADWAVCFNARGIADEDITIVLRDSKGNTSSIEVFLAGGIRIT